MDGWEQQKENQELTQMAMRLFKGKDSDPCGNVRILRIRGMGTDNLKKFLLGMMN